jgi:hypothetical protein
MDHCVSAVPTPRARGLNNLVVLPVTAFTTPPALARLELCSLTLPITDLENGGWG